MVVLKKVSEAEDVIRYQYIPEDEGKPGIIDLYPKTHSYDMIEYAEKDNPHSQFYMGQVRGLFRIFIKQKDFPEEYRHIWY